MSTKRSSTCKRQDASNHPSNISSNWKALLKVSGLIGFYSMSHVSTLKKMQESPEAKKSTVHKKFGKKRLKHEKSKRCMFV